VSELRRLVAVMPQRRLAAGIAVCLAASCVQVLAASGPPVQTLIVNGHTVDLILSGNQNDPTVVYFPGCNGRDAYGAKYQDFHVEKIRQAWNGRVNIVRPQLVNDVTRGAVGGNCFWDSQRSNANNLNSYHLAQQVGDIATGWLRQQPWFNGHAHFFGFSFGGRVSLQVNSILKTRGAFHTVTAIWPMCREEYRFEANYPHTPSRFYATQGDPLSEIANCLSHYPQGSERMIKIITYPGDFHSWMTHPDVTLQRVWWPNHRLWVTSAYVDEYADSTWKTWSDWARCVESGVSGVSC
jgi:dienelactone hydrolase